MTKRKSGAETLFDALYELTESFWPIGVVVSFLLTVAGFTTLSWVIELKSNKSSVLMQVFNDGWISYLPYILPVVIFLLALIFAYRSLNVFLTQNTFI